MVTEHRNPLQRRSSVWLPVVVALGLVGLSANTPLQAQAGRGDVALTPELATVRAGLDKYKDPILAVHDGFLSSVACLNFSQGSSGHGDMDYKAGAMGVHFINMGNIGPTLDPAKPQVLIYEPVGDGLRLVAAEWFMPTQVSNVAPTIFGKKLQGPMEGHEPVLPQELHHFDLHVWLWKANPNGMFSSTNPAVTCPKGPYSIDEKPPKMVK
jgi:hypothetical protein